MKKVLFSLLITCAAFAQVNFEDYFEDKSLRIDYIHGGNATEDFMYLDELLEEPYWGGSKVNLIDKFEYGKYKVEVVDVETGNLIYSRTYSTLFSEWQTTAEAKTIQKSFPEGVVVPFPKKTAQVLFYSRDREHKLHKKLEVTVDPTSMFISEERRREAPNFKVHYSGDPAVKVDVVLIPEGYTAEEMDEFKADCEKFAEHLFGSSPFRENKDKFNIWGIDAPSEQSGTDYPARNQWKKTLLNTTFYSLGLERYLMTTDQQAVLDAAANAPHDQMYILVNTSRYGGGAIYNYYSVSINKNTNAEYVAVHEFGHGFAFLGDEYYTSDVAYEEFYPTDIEPLEPNLTTLVDFESKWKDLIDEDTPIPTPATKEYRNKVGAFEGGGYAAKDVYRPMQDCQMKSITVDNMCPVCKRAIIKMIEFYTE